MKIQHNFKLEPEQLAKLKKRAKQKGTTVSHEIRQGIRKQLNTK